MEIRQQVGHDDYTSDKLLKDLASGNNHAVTYLFDSYGKSLYFFCNSLLKDKELAEDVVQEAFVRLWEKRKDFHSIFSIRTFLYQVSRNLSIDHIRYKQTKKKHDLAITMELSNNSINDKMIEEELIGKLYRAVEQLPTECAKIFKLYLNGKSNQEIADLLSISINTVRVQKNRAKNALKKQFGVEATLFFIIFFSKKYRNIV